MDQEKELFKEIFDNVNYWLAYGEAKNAGLLAFNIAVIAMLFSLDNYNIGDCFVAWIFIISTGVALSAIWAKYIVKKKNRTPDANDNLLFYLHIAKYSEEEYIAKIYDQYFDEELPNASDVPIYIKHIVSEICTNAKIATRKFDYFNYGTVLDLIALIILLINVIVKAVA